MKSKIAFNLTKRQLICFGSGGLVGIPAYILTRGSIGNDAAALLMIVLMLPFFFFGVYEKDGQPLEKVLGHFIRARFLCPQTRPYQTDNFYAALERQAQMKREDRKFDPKAKKTGKKTSNRKKRASGRKGRAAGCRSART